MKKFWTAFLLFICTSMHVSAGLVSVASLNPDGYLFNGVAFGSPPQSTMECIHGNCLQDGRVTLPYSTYLWQERSDIWADIPMTSPRFNYWQDKLFRVSFYLQCSPEDEEFWLEQTLDALQQQDPLVLIAIEDRFTDHATLQVHRMIYISPEGAIVSIERNTFAGRHEAPRFVIYNKRVKDEVAQRSNPAFKAKPLSIPRHILEQSPA